MPEAIFDARHKTIASVQAALESADKVFNAGVVKDSLPLAEVKDAIRVGMSTDVHWTQYNIDLIYEAVDKVCEAANDVSYYLRPYTCLHISNYRINLQQQLSKN